MSAPGLRGQQIATITLQKIQKWTSERDATTD